MAEKGKGAFLADRTGRDRRLRVSARRDFGDALITTGIPHRGRGGHDTYLKEAKHLMTHVAGLRRTGSAATDLAWVAAGRFDGYYERNIGAWDVAAGIVLVREAGGTATDMAGGQDMITKGEVCVGNQTMHKALLSAVQAA
jgi:myo-inositol-1(or 4)-monophosphatase